MWPKPQFPVDLVTFTEEILNGKLCFFVQLTENVEAKMHYWVIIGCYLYLMHMNRNALKPVTDLSHPCFDYRSYAIILILSQVITFDVWKYLPQYHVSPSHVHSEKSFQFITDRAKKQLPRSVLRKRCSEITQQIYRRTPMPKSNFIEIVLRHGCSPVNLLHIFRTPFYKNTSGWVLLRAYGSDNFP